VQEVEEIAAHEEALSVAGLAALGEIKLLRAPSHHPGKRSLMRAQTVPLRRCEGGAARGPPSRPFGVLREIEIRQFLRTAHRQRAQPDGVDQLKNSGVRPDPERERQHCHRRECWIKPKLPKSET
jgi:hypothetical protein